VPAALVDQAAGAVLACGRGAGLAYGSAGTMWGYSKEWRLPFEVVVRSVVRRPGIIVHRSRTLTPRDFRIQRGVRVTSPARTVLDIAARLNPRELTRTVNDALLRGFLQQGELADVLARNPRHPGARLLAPLVEDPGNPTRSAMEDDFRVFCTRHGLPDPEVNVYVNGREVDALFREQQVIVELDGYTTHSSRASFEDDRDRDAEMLRTGHVTVRGTWERLRSRPAREAARLHEILRSRTVSAAPATGSGG
jgi:hypothetical protein